MPEKTVIDEYVEKAKAAQQIVDGFNQEQVDAIVKAIGKVIYDNAEMIAEEAVAETGYGRVDSKIYKMQKCTCAAWYYLRDKKSVGIIDVDLENDVVTFAKPMGVIACLTPSTNPVSTAASNCMHAVKDRNAVIVSPHPSAKNVSIHGVRLIQEAIKEAGAPDNLIQVVEEPTMDATNELMRKCDVVIATGGQSMVKSAYSSGRPCYGVGQGNVQVIVAPDYKDFGYLANMVVTGRSYDNGVPCTGEQALYFPRDEYDEIIAAFEKEKAALLPDESVKALPGLLYRANGTSDPKHVGQKPSILAAELGVEIPEDTLVLLFNDQGRDRSNVLRREKICAVIQLFPYDDFEDAVALAKDTLLWEGAGHTSVIYTNDTNYAEYAAAELPVGRILVNQNGGAASGGNYINGLDPTMSLGCGSWGNNTISDNLTYKNLMNTTKLAYYHDSTLPPYDEVWKL